jgi:hypothetical protein
MSIALKVRKAFHHLRPACTATFPIPTSTAKGKANHYRHIQNPLTKPAGRAKPDACKFDRRMLEKQ